MKTDITNFDTIIMSKLLASVSGPLNNSSDLDPLIREIGDAKYVLLGEASHGTHEYYTWRMKISRRLIEEKGFSFVAVEGDWPDCYRLNRYLKNYPYAGKNARSVLQSFNRWPTWMWANWETAAFAEWLKKFNTGKSVEKKVGFYGLDVYSLWESMEAIIGYLQDHDADTLKLAIRAVRCFEPYNSDEGRSYADTSAFVPELCESEVTDLLYRIREKVPQYNSDYENVFSTEQNAWVAVNAEKYYRAMIKGGPESWNIRDRHMADTLNRLMKFHRKNSKVIVWEHNTHIGDARATGMSKEGMINLGQLVREQHSVDGVVSVGFGSYHGSVIAGREWNDPMKKMRVPPAIEGSWEYFLHHTAPEKDKLLMLHSLKNMERMKESFGHRAIGVVYHPEYEQYGNYVPSILPKRYDAFIFIDETNALHPLHIKPDGRQVPETFPFGM